ncbi:hypothetical protein SISNIDRAFT_441879 [Sistotremastrum niveocremeum HHB9708]|uniref:Novel STAND NTPase 1 domain-containing protein n=1 Tax=Sistotremastrum niveocremeum HHB9708 TaxID=1314777 RepID=A0A164TUL1_9AGAM|nr:hypothetical protein SISNIDRAFT_441879 [Sistotremastrum niveocremeum HHB9708]
MPAVVGGYVSSKSATSSAVAFAALRSIAELSSSSYARIIANLAVVIVENVQGKYSECLAGFNDQVLSTAWAIADALDKSGDLLSEEIVRCAGQLLRTLENISVSIRRRLDRGKFFRLWNSSGENEIVLKHSEDLDRCLSIFLFQSKLANLRQSSRLVKSTKNFEDEFGDTVQKAYQEQTSLLDLVATHTPTMLEECRPSVLPACPQVFFGRSEALSLLLDQVCTPTATNVAILGSGGIGKTSLALMALHHERTVTVFGGRRRFLPCESLPDAKALVAAVGHSFGISGKQILQDLKHLLLKKNSPNLIVLDNFETSWESSAKRTEVEDVLVALTDIPYLSVIVTMRGAERPSGVLWRRPFLPPLPSLDPNLSKAMFVAISDVDEDDEHLERLLEVTDHVPLAVTLMANLAQYTGCGVLLSRWNEEKTSMLTRGYDGRLSSVDVSIRVSLGSERFLRSPHAKLLLQILSLLPDGASRSALPSMTGQSDGILSAISTLKQVGLAQEDSTGNIRVLCPVREYVTKHLPMTNSELAPLRTYYYAFTSQLAESSEKQPGMEELAMFKWQMANMSTVLLHALRSDEPQVETISAFLRLGSFAWAPGVSAELFPAALQVARDLQSQKLEADCLVFHYRFSNSGHNEDSLRELQSAAKIYRHRNSEDDAPNLAQCLSCLGDSYRRLGDFGESIKFHLEAVELYTRCGNYEMMVESLRRLANAYSAACMPLEASRTIEQALTMSEKHGLHLITASILKIMGVVQYTRAAFPLAFRTLKRSAELQYQILGESRAYDETLLMIGITCHKQSRLKNAHEYLTRAHRISAKFGKPDWIAMSTLCLGAVALDRSEMDLAMRHFHVSLRRFTELGHANNQAQCLIEIAKLELRRHNITTAWTHLLEARKRIRGPRDVKLDAEVAVIYQMGEVAYARKNHASALTLFITSCIIDCRISDRSGVAECIKRIGDIMLADGAIDDAKACYMSSLGLTEHLGVRRQIADCMAALGDVALHRDESAAAERWHHDALLLYEKAEDQVGQKACREKISAYGSPCTSQSDFS